MRYDVIIIGGGQSALACAYFLRRSTLSYTIIDEQSSPGGAWNHGWDSLKLFSPAEFSSLPGWLMPRGAGLYPTKNEVIHYLEKYEERYKFNIIRNTTITQVIKKGDEFELSSKKQTFHCRALISATGTWKKPYIPHYDGIELFEGFQLHSAQYRNAEEMKNKSIAIIGGGNSAAQILAEVSQVANTHWITQYPPQFLDDDIDGRYLFDYATQQYKARQEGKAAPKASLGDIVMVDSVKEARERNVLNSFPPFEAFTNNGIVWSDGKQQALDGVIWCTGFKPALQHLSHLVDGQNKDLITKGTQSKVPGLWLVGYGNWTGFASATLIGVGRSARQTIKEIESFLTN